jgi:hypothetical protein
MNHEDHDAQTGKKKASSLTYTDDGVGIGALGGDGVGRSRDEVGWGV